MAYIRKDYYEGIYGEIPDNVFSNLCWEACRVLDNHTTGIDNVRKLKSYFPTDEDDAETVKRCAAKIVNFLYQVNEYEAATLESAGYETTEQGMRGKIISSVSAGNETISYSVRNSVSSNVEAAAKDWKVRDKIVADIVWEHLSGVEDANGVNLLYMGRYPC